MASPVWPVNIASTTELESCRHLLSSNYVRNGNVAVNMLLILGNLHKLLINLISVFLNRFRVTIF